MINKIYFLFWLFLFPTSFLLSQEFDEQYERQSETINVNVGFSVLRAINAGILVHISDNTSIEASVGTLPFTSLLGFRVLAIGGAFNWYFEPKFQSTMFLSNVVAFTNVSVQNRILRPAGYLMISPMLGFDFIRNKRMRTYFKVGYGFAVSSSYSPKDFLSGEMGILWNLSN